MKKWGIIVPTSMGVRITPDNGLPVGVTDRYTMQATSAETNVASIASYLGIPVKVLTTFVKDSPIADFIKRDLRNTKVPRFRREGPGDTDISSISPTAASDHADRACSTTVRVRSAGRLT